MIHIAKPNIGIEEKRAVLEVLNSAMLAQGDVVLEFEKELCDYFGVGHAIVTSNGTTALHAALIANGIGLGDEVITTSFSFIATGNVIKMCLAKPVFVDVDLDSFNIDVSLIEKAITSKTKAIMPVHLFGRPAQMDEIERLAKRYNLIVIEDSCQAHGATFNGKKVGSYGTGCFSFYPTKNMTTGEGGVILTNDEKVASDLRKIISHGSVKRYYHDSLGFNYRMTNISAAIGLEQLKKLDYFNSRRINNAKYLNENLEGIAGLVLPKIVDGHVFHQYTIRLTSEFGISRDEFISLLREGGVGSSVFYPLPIHKQEAYKEFNHICLSVSEKVSREVVSLPVHPLVDYDDLVKIVSVIKDICKGKEVGENNAILKEVVEENVLAEEEEN
jgi:dTDP-4-amino-4,6-dideoxygalactose transaminase